jgi:hypothetical protein
LGRRGFALVDPPRGGALIRVVVDWIHEPRSTALIEHRFMSDDKTESVRIGRQRVDFAVTG